MDNEGDNMNPLTLLLPGLISSACLLAPHVGAQVLTVPPLFSDHAVLQRDRAIPVWGTAAPGEKISVSMAGHSVTTKAKSDGRWRLRLPSLKAGGPHTLTIAAKDRTLTIEDVLIGDVWVCSGQSNMEWPLKSSCNGDAEVAEANHPQLRLYTVPQKVADTPQDTCGGQWMECTPESAESFSAIAYFFGRHLHTELGVPIGLFDTSWGGTPAESWTSQRALAKHEELASIVEAWDGVLEHYPLAKAEYDGQLADWEAAKAQAEAKGETAPPPPPMPMGPGHPWQPSGLYNGMIHPLIPYGIRGAIWYQGESNTDRAYQYRVLFPAMIRDWRKNWGQGAFPFLFVQLANFMDVREEPVSGSLWAELREAQSMTLKLRHTGMAVAIDIGEAEDIHPRNKQDVGKRLALAALRVAYKQDLPYSGAVYASKSIRGSEVKLRFKNTFGGLRTLDGGPLKGFAITGEDRHLVWADARIEGDTVIVSSSKVAKPVAVRYAWADNPECNLYNGAGLPASPFRTDTWAGLSSGEPALLPQFDLPEGGILFHVRGTHAERTPGWLVNNGASCFASLGYWAIRGNGVEVFRWKIGSVPPGKYEILAWLTDDPNGDHATDALYTITAAEGVKTVTIDQSADTRRWVSLGVFAINDISFIELTNKASGNVIADAISLVPFES
jgi:sialate O-acetylesterase